MSKETTPRVQKQKNETIAFVLSAIFAGLGEAYLGKVVRGLAIFAGGVALGVMSSYLFGILFGSPILGYVPAIAYWIWQMWDTHKTYKKLYPQVV